MSKKKKITHFYKSIVRKGPTFTSKVYFPVRSCWDGVFGIYKQAAVISSIFQPAIGAT